MQPASQVDILIWRSVLRSSRSSKYIKPIKPPRHPVPHKMSSNYRLYSSLSLLFASHSMKMYYTHTRQLFLQPQHLTQLLPRFCKQLALLAKLFGDGWDCRSLQLPVWALSAYAGGTSISCWASSPGLVSLISVTPGSLAAFSQLKRQLGVDWPRIQTCLCVFGGFILVTVSFICPKALSGRVLATF